MQEPGKELDGKSPFEVDLKANQSMEAASIQVRRGRMPFSGYRAASRVVPVGPRRGIAHARNFPGDRTAGVTPEVEAAVFLNK